MPEFMTCFACENEPTQQCPRCGRPYCDEHGEDVCDSCLQPVSGLPSFTLYRGSLLALLIGTALAVWLLIQPPGGNNNAPQASILATPTPQVGVNTTPLPTLAPEPVATPDPGISGGPAGTGEYTVEAGDALFAICESIKPASMSVSECVDRVVELNSLASPDDISIGETLIVPQ